MSFSIKHLLAVILLISVGLAALANADKPFAVILVQLSTVMALVLAAYGIWTSRRENRAFLIGFGAWGGIYFLLHVILRGEQLNLGTDLLSALVDSFQPGVFTRDSQGTITGVHGAIYDRFFQIGHCLLTVLFGLIGGLVTVYFYHKRQRMLDR